MKRRWLPTKYQTYETPNKFLIGTRYCFSRNIDIRSYGEMGLYVPRFPQHIENSTSFLSSFRGTESRVYNEFTRGELVYCICFFLKLLK